MSVKTIFKVILGTIATIVISSLVIELFNLELQSMQMTKLINVSGKQAAALFAQETYKSDSGAGSANMPNLRTTDGGVYVSGNFYNGTSEASIYNSIYTSSEFRNWVGANRGKWLSVDCIASGLGLGSGGLGPNEIMSGQMYVNNYVTPLNMGVPYMDKDTLQKMFRWNLTQTLSNCREEAIVQDAFGQYAVAYNGFMVYANRAEITDIEYKVLDLTDSNDAKEFYKYTSVNPANLNGKAVTTSIGVYTEDTTLMSDVPGYGDERRYACLVGINYRVPVSYEGVTFMRTIISYLWSADARVEGLDGNIPDKGYASWNPSTPWLTSGGFQEDINPGDVPIPNTLVYYIVR